MKISELISLLQTYQQDYGDIEVKKEIVERNESGDFYQQYVKLDYVSVNHPWQGEIHLVI